LIHDEMMGFDAERPVFVEAESPKIGHLNIPAPLWRVMRESEVLEIQVPLRIRRDYLKGDYAPWIAEPERILARVERLRPFHSGEQVAEWRRQCEAGHWPEFIESLLREHYDRRYGAAGSGHYHEPSSTFALAYHGAESITACAAWLQIQGASSL
jgi:tRNA 2-selenouridine synthase